MSEEEHHFCTLMLRHEGRTVFQQEVKAARCIGGFISEAEVQTQIKSRKVESDPDPARV